MFAFFLFVPFNDENFMKNKKIFLYELVFFINVSQFFDKCHYNSLTSFILSIGNNFF